MPLMRMTKAKPYKPWYKTGKNTFLTTSVVIDIDRMGNMFQLNLYHSQKPDGEKVEDIIRVEHLGNLFDGADHAIGAVGIAFTMDTWYHRAFTSGDIECVKAWLDRNLPTLPTFGPKFLARLEQLKAKYWVTP